MCKATGGHSFTGCEVGKWKCGHFNATLQQNLKVGSAGAQCGSAIPHMTEIWNGKRDENCSCSFKSPNWHGTCYGKCMKAKTKTTTTTKAATTTKETATTTEG